MSEISVRFKDMSLLSAFFVGPTLHIKVGKTSAITLVPHTDQAPKVDVQRVDQQTDVITLLAFEPIKVRISSKTMVKVTDPDHLAKSSLLLRTALSCLDKTNVVTEELRHPLAEPIAKFAEHGAVADAGITPAVVDSKPAKKAKHSAKKK